MKYQIHISDEAQLDIKEIKEYYLKIDNKLTKRCLSDIITTIDSLSNTPTHHQERYRGIRIAFTSTFPYGIHYTFKNKKVTILRVFHTKRFFK
jgi:plasmid stabilization system protein ParE